MDAKTRLKISEGLKRFYRTGQKAVDETVTTVKTNVKTTAKKKLWIVQPLMKKLSP